MESRYGGNSAGLREPQAELSPVLEGIAGTKPKPGQGPTRPLADLYVTRTRMHGEFRTAAANFAFDVALCLS